MGSTKESMVEKAKRDLAERLGLPPEEVKEIDVSDRDFPDMSLGAPLEDEMSAQMISSGWQIRLEGDGKSYEYRADKYQLRLHNYNGSNFVIVSD